VLKSKKLRALLVGAFLIFLGDLIGINSKALELVQGLAIAYLSAQGVVDSVLSFKGGKNG